MEAQDVNPALFANSLKFTENGIQLPFGKEGLWYRMSGKGTYEFYVPDTKTQQFAFIRTVRKGGVVSKIRDRRFVTVNRERGIVFAFVFFDHNNINWTWQMAELFKIEDDEIHRIEAIFQQSA